LIANKLLHGSPNGAVEKPKNRSAHLGGFSKNLSSWNIREFRFQKIAKASFRTPKTTFSTVPKGEHPKFPSPSSFSEISL
jgi:hypothetical protein